VTCVLAWAAVAAGALAAAGACATITSSEAGATSHIFVANLMAVTA
jgi:hypothetical protein